MKRLFICIITCAIFLSTLCFGVAGASEAEGYKALYTVEAKTGYVIDGKEVDKRLPIASMVKIMTTLIGFEAVKSGRLSLAQEVVISDTAAGMGGSQMFLEEGDTYKVSDLFKGIIVVSANDACVQIAEVLEGSEEKFVQKMNDKAKELGMNDTKFVNCTGLPCEGQYSTAHDVSIMLRELLKYPEYHEYSKIWIEEFNHPDGRVTQFVNTNKLVRFYKNCTGGKTGFTSEAGFCLAASAEKDGTHIISVIIGADSSKTRFSTITKQFDTAFCTYQTKNVLKLDTIAQEVDVLGGKTEKLSVHPSRPYFKFGKIGEDNKVELSIDLPKNIKAPVKKDEVIGTVTVYDGEIITKVDLLANEEILAISYWDISKKLMKSW